MPITKNSRKTTLPELQAKIVELQKKNFSKQEIFEQLKENNVNDLFLSREIARLPLKYDRWYFLRKFFGSLFSPKLEKDPVTGLYKF